MSIDKMALQQGENLLNFLGNTPLLKLSAANQTRGNIFAKVEYLNPGGSIKTRTAYGMIKAAEEKGELNEDSIIVEPTSGNQGIGLSMVGAIHGYKVKIVMPASMSMERRKMMTAFGAELELVESGENITETFELTKNKAQTLKAEDPRVYIPDQFENQANPDIHRRTTAQEILNQMEGEGKIDAFVAGVGTGGTLTGVGEVLKEKFPNIKIVAVEPENAAVLTQGNVSDHIQQGIGDGFIPGVLNQDLIDDVVVVSDEDALETARSLCKKEGAMVGVSSGTNIWAAYQVAEKLPAGANIVTVFPDGGDRYFSTPLFDK